MKNLYLLIFLFLTACATTQEATDSREINQDEGILVVGLDTNWEGHKNPFLASLELLYNGTDNSSLNYRSMSFKGNDYILVTKLPAQEYFFYRIRFGNRFADLNKGATFNIKSGEITYIGEIHMDLSLALFSAAASLKVNDNWDSTLEYLHKKYPLLLSNRPITRSIINMELAH